MLQRIRVAKCSGILQQKYFDFRLFEDVPRLFFPILWFEQKVTIPEELTSQVKLLLDLPFICTITAWVSMAISGFMAFLLVYISLKQTGIYRRNNRNVADKEIETVCLKNPEFQHYLPKGRRARKAYLKAATNYPEAA